MIQALWNIGEKEKACALWSGEKTSIYDFTKKEMQDIKKELLKCDIEILKPQYEQHKKQYFNEDRKIIVDMLNEWGETFRTYSLLTK